ncbi:nuclear pore complex protein Nup133 [Maniola hyperantus]|uniref:nuclear pore complex protein Nup133 n=1 Tax=Aphantopus hyperantus TaxID=2795564 RepID=UPI0037495381
MEFNSSGGMRSPFSPRVRQSIGGRRPAGLGSAKKNQSKFMQSMEQQPGDIIYKTALSTIETFGMPLPVMVTETLTFASGDVSVRMSPCGWCWVVAGRRVLAWPREPAASPGAPAAARELTLPQTDLAHKADLVVLFYEEGVQMPSCIGVSPEGVVRYWACVGTEGAYTDVSCELAGQECDRLTEAKDGLLLATTTCTLVRITTSKEGRPTVVCQTLRPPSGWLGGIGRKVSLLFFGSMPAHADTKLVGVVVLPAATNTENPEEEEDECIALLAGGPLLQLWCGAEVNEHNLRRPLSEAFARSHLAPQGDLNSLEIMALDVHAHGPRGLLLLLAAVNVARSPEMRYALAHVSVEQRDRARVASLCAVRVPRDDEPPKCLPLPTRPLLYTSTYVACFSPAATEKAEYVDVSAEADRILGAAFCDGLPLLFSRKHGVLLLRAAEPGPQHHHTPSICDSPMGSPCPSDMYDSNLALYEIDPHEVSAMSTDAVGKLKSAFLFHVRGDASSAARLTAELFPRTEPHSDAPLDRTVLALAQDMLDDAPAGDPRWKLRSGGATRVALGSSAALQTSAQLRDKQRALSLFLDFLRAHNLWRRLGTVTRENEEGTVSTQYELCSLGERLAAARALQRLHQEGAHLVDAALHRVTASAENESSDSPEGEEPEVLQALRSGALSAADVCFRRVTRIGRVLRALAELPPPAHDPRAAAHHALHALTALATALSEMQKCRAQAPPRPAPPLGPRALLSCLAHLHKRAVTTALSEMQKCRAQAPPRPAPPLGPRALLSCLAHLHKRATALSEMQKCRAQAPPRPAPPLGPRALLSCLAHLHKRAVTSAARRRRRAPRRRSARARCSLVWHISTSAQSREYFVHGSIRRLRPQTALSEMQKCRAQAPPRPAPPLGPRALLSCLAHLHKRAVTECAHKCEDINLRAQVLEAAATLADLLLSEADPLRHSARTIHLYERMRTETIQPYIQEGQIERAAVLAEKFKDFDLLIEMCVQRNDMQRLYGYIDKYADEGMAEKAFAWLASRGGSQCALLLRSLGSRAGDRLRSWLAAAPDRLSLRALHHLAAGDTVPAAKLYAEMADQETYSVARMSTMASIAKLCLLAGDEPEPQQSDTWRKAECRLSLAEQHYALPRELRLHHGLDDDDNTRVLEPEELVQMYIDSASRSLTEYDYKKALDLTDFVQDMERRDELRLRVWCACILRDDWSVCRVDAPAAEMQDKMFFRLLDLVHLMGGDLELLLPPVEDILTAPELAELVSDPRFHFLIKYGYECVDANRSDHNIVDTDST